MSKAFTKEDEGVGFEHPAPTSRHGDGRLTAYGAQVLRDKLAAEPNVRLQELLDGAAVLTPARSDHAALGARVVYRSDAAPKEKRSAVLVTPEEVGIVPHGISASSPLGSALLGAKVGDVLDIELPRGSEELEVLAVEWP